MPKRPRRVPPVRRNSRVVLKPASPGVFAKKFHGSKRVTLSESTTPNPPQPALQHRRHRRHSVVRDRQRRRSRALVTSQIDRPSRVRPHTLPPIRTQPTSPIRKRPNVPNKPPLRGVRAIRTTRQLTTIRRQLMQIPKRRLTRRVRHEMPVIDVRHVVTRESPSPPPHQDRAPASPAPQCRT